MKGRGERGEGWGRREEREREREKKKGARVREEGRFIFCLQRKERKKGGGRRRMSESPRLVWSAFLFTHPHALPLSLSEVNLPHCRVHLLFMWQLWHFLFN